MCLQLFIYDWLIVLLNVNESYDFISLSLIVGDACGLERAYLELVNCVIEVNESYDFILLCLIVNVRVGRHRLCAVSQTSYLVFSTNAAVST